MGHLDGVTATKTVNYGYDDTNWKDKLSSYDGQAITYDEIGNPLSYRGYTLTWQNGRQLATLSGNGVTASYTYDVDGLRTSKTVNGVKHEYYYVGNTLQYEKFGTTELWFFYDPMATPPVFATRTAALQPTTTLSATGAEMLFAFTTVQVRLLPTTTMTLGAM